MTVASYSNKTSSAAVYTGAGYFHGAILTAAGDTATLIVYDNTSGTGTIICKLSALTNTTVSFVPDAALPFYTGCFAALTGTSPSATVVYTP